MAAILAAGAASCAGYVIGKLATRSKPRPRTERATGPNPRVRGGSFRSPPSEMSFVDLAPRTKRVPPQRTMTGPLVLPPRRPVPGQCPLCYTWFQQGDVVARLACSHVCHKQCLETVSNQQLYETYRCTCAMCNGPSTIVSFAVTEFTPMLPVADPQVRRPPFKPLTPALSPAVHSPSVPPPPVPRDPSPPLRVLSATRLPIASPPPRAPSPPPRAPSPPPRAPSPPPRAPSPPPRAPSPPPRAPSPIAAAAPSEPVVKKTPLKKDTTVALQLSVLHDASSILSGTRTSKSSYATSEASTASRAPSPPPIVVDDNEGVTPFCLASLPVRGGAYPSCSLCDCAACADGGDGVCPDCGHCACAECAARDCECICTGCGDVEDHFSLVSGAAFY